MAVNLDLTQYTTVWDESFDNGTGMLSRDWGPGINTSVPGQITLNSTPDQSDSGTMVPPTGTNAGYGYGLFSFTLSLGQGDAPGAYALLGRAPTSAGAGTRPDRNPAGRRSLFDHPLQGCGRVQPVRLLLHGRRGR